MPAKPIFLLTFILLLISVTINAQKTKFYPITRDTLNTFSDSLLIKGRVVDYTYGPACGIVCSSGFLKINLLNKNRFYAWQFIYVGVPCMTIDIAKKMSKKTTWVLRKISLNDKSCFWTEAPMNKFDTKGLPFYQLVSAKN